MKFDKYLDEEMEGDRYIGYHVSIQFNGYQMISKPSIVKTSNATKALSKVGGETIEKAKEKAISELEKAIKAIKKLKKV